jgi:hypothetical protein
MRTRECIATNLCYRCTNTFRMTHRHICNPKAHDRKSKPTLFNHTPTHDNRQVNQNSRGVGSSQRTHANSTNNIHYVEQDRYFSKKKNSNHETWTSCFGISLVGLITTVNNRYAIFVTNRSLWMRKSRTCSGKFFSVNMFFQSVYQRPGVDNTLVLHMHVEVLHTNWGRHHRLRIPANSHDRKFQTTFCSYFRLWQQISETL